MASSTEGSAAAIDTDSGVEVNPSPVKGEFVCWLTYSESL